ncbi:MAG: response regulator transcription factor [Bacteroidota bacterium]
MSEYPYTILIVDDHKVLANGLAALLEKQDSLKVKGIAHNGKEALEFLQKEAVDLLITDINMPDMNGIELLTEIRQCFKAQKVMVLSMHQEVSVVKSILKLNPEAFLSKHADEKVLIEAINSVKEGEVYYGEDIKSILIDSLRGADTSPSEMVPTLSRREIEVLGLIAQEFSTKEIAEKLFLSLHTIETYRKNLLRKLDARNSVGLVAKAYQLGLLES